MASFFAWLGLEPERRRRRKASSSHKAMSTALQHALEVYRKRLEEGHGRGGRAPILLDDRRAYVVLVRVSGGTRSALAFVDKSNGDLYRADSWKKRGRKIGNVFRLEP